jgi:hypothetical protein
MGAGKLLEGTLIELGELFLPLSFRFHKERGDGKSYLIVEQEAKADLIFPFYKPG